MKFSGCFHKGGKKTDVIVDSILKIIESGNTKNDLILIYSNESISEYRDNQSKLKHIEDKLTKRTDFWQLIIYKMWAIKKSGNLSNLLPQLYKMLLCSIYGNALYNVIHYKLDVEKSAYKDLIAINTNELLNTIKDTFIEGDNIIQTLIRIYEGLKIKNEFETKNNIYLSSIQELISYEHEEINQEYDIITNTLNSDSSSNETPFGSYRTKRLKSKLEQACSDESISHHCIIDYTINRYYTDISTGDIFRFRKENGGKLYYGILISQTCDCIIRIPYDNRINYFDRRSKDMKILLCKYQKITPELSEDEVLKLKNDIPKYIWPVKSDNEFLILKPTDEIIVLDDYILDLCTLNDNGKAKLDCDINEALKYKSFHSNKYFANFIEKYYGNNSRFKKIGENILSQFIGEIYKVLKQASQEVTCTSDPSDSVIMQNHLEEHKCNIFNSTITLKYGILYKNNEFDLERIGRLEPKRALLIIQNMANKLSRVGTDPIASIS